MADVVLRELVDADKWLIFRWISNPALRKMTGTRGIPTEDLHERWFERKRQDNVNLTFVIEYSGIPVGLIGTNTKDDLNKNAEIYLYLGEDEMKRKGIAAKAIHLMTEILFQEYFMHKITARIFSFNKPSIALFEKCGFKHEGTQKEQIYGGETDHCYYDLLWYGLLAK